MGIPDSSYGEAPKLDLGHKIFLCHSGEDKDFVRMLAKELRNRWYNPFFDEESLPKAKIVLMENILKEVQYCKLAILVLSEEFFTRNKNPMMEVIAFVRSKVKLLPLFYKLTVEDIKDKQNRALWKAKWDEWNVQLSGSSLDSLMWDKALTQITDHNGIKNSVNNSAYVEEIANEVCNVLPPDVLRDDKHVVGKERLIKKVEHMFAICPVVEGRVKILALHGIEGMGKTTLSQALCNFYLTAFGGRVCFVELHMGSQLDRIKTILSQLTTASYEHIKRCTRDLGKALNFLRQELELSKKFFLVVDNIQDSFASDQEEVRQLFLNNLKVFPKGSKLLLLARSCSTLWRVLNPLPKHDNTQCIHTFPGLNYDEAKIILWTEIPQLFPEGNMSGRQQLDLMNQCVKLCTIRKGSSVYNPLMLKSLAFSLNQMLATIQWSKTFAPLQSYYSEGTEHLRRLKKYLTTLDGDHSPGMKVFFDVLQRSFSSLGENHQDLFLDIALYAPSESALLKQPHMQTSWATLNESLQKLRDVSFLLEGHDMLDVHREFAKGIARNSTKFLYVEHKDLRGADLRQMVNHNLNRVAFVKCNFHKPRAELDLISCNDIRVLLLDKNSGLEYVILGSNQLQSVDIRSATPPLLVRQAAIPGNFLHEQLFPFSDFKCLAMLELGGIEDIMWQVDVAQLSYCDSLEVMQLYNVNIVTLEVSSWTNLRELKLSWLPNLEFLYGMEHLNILRKLHLFQLNALKSLPGVQSLHNLKVLIIASCDTVSELKLPVSLEHCSIEECDNLTKIEFVRCDEEQNENELSSSSEADSSDVDDCTACENRFIVNDCGNLHEINGLAKLTSVHSFFYSAPEKGQLSNLKELDFQHAKLGISCRISYFEFHGNPSIWGLHGLALEQVKCGYLQELVEFLQDAVGLKYLRILCDDSDLCGCNAMPPNFHLLPSVQRLEYHCSHVADLSILEQCSRLRSLHLDGCINAATWTDFSKLLSLSELHAPCSWNQASGQNLCGGCRGTPMAEMMKPWADRVKIVLRRSECQRRISACKFKSNFVRLVAKSECIKCLTEKE